MTLNNALVLIIGVVAIIWYYICLIGIGIHPLPIGTPADAFRQFMSLSLTSLGASMATFIGMLLGIRSISGTVRTEVAATSTDTPNLKQLAAGAFTTSLQWWAAALYVVSLLVALWFWYHTGDLTDPAISNLGKSLLGLFGGALSIALNLPRDK